MIEILGNATVTEAGEASGYDLQLTGITFHEGDLCQPRYPMLFNYDRAPQGVRFEPGVQILVPGRQLQFLFQLEAGVEFLVVDGRPVVVSVAYPSATSIPGLTAVLPDPDDPTTCLLTWDQAEAERVFGGPIKVTALRLRCMVNRVTTPGEEADGGVYLAIVNRPKEAHVDLGIGDAGQLEPDTIKMLGSDPQGRPVYDLFQPDALPAVPSDLSLEPTVRVRSNEEVKLSLLLATPEILEFKQAPGNPGQVQVNPFEPPVWPPELQNAAWKEDGLRCDLIWRQGPKTSGHTGCVSTFYLDVWQPVLGGVGPMQRLMQVDPTVIQPPSCTGSICV